MLLQGLRRGGPPPGGAPERQRLAGTFLKGQPALLVGHCGARTGRPRPPTAERQAVPGGGFVQTGAAAPVLRGPFSLVTSPLTSLDPPPVDGLALRSKVETFFTVTMNSHKPLRL